MQREARIALQVVRLARLPHRADPELAVARTAVSVPEMRGEPSRRTVASVLCGWASSRRAPRSASSGAAASNSSSLACADGGGRRPRRPAGSRIRSSDDVGYGRPPARADRPRARLARRARRGRAARSPARALLARSPRPPAGGATGETPAALRRRLLLERAAWQLRTGAATPSEATPRRLRLARRLLARVRARPRRPPSAFGPIQLEAPNGIHFHPPAGLLIPGARPVGRRDLTERLVAPSRPRARAARGRGDAARRRARAPLRPGLRRRLVRGRGAERGGDGRAARVHARGLGRGDRRRAACPQPGAGDLLRASTARHATFARLARAIRDRGAWDDAFVDALCEPPQSFTYGGVARARPQLRRGAPRGARERAGRARRAPVSSGDPIEWEAGR